MNTLPRNPEQLVTMRAEKVCKTYQLGKVGVPVLKSASIEVHEREWVAILGASGSGKSTLLHLLGGLDRPDADRGKVWFGNSLVSSLTRGPMDRYRNRAVGFVFQFYHLLPELTVLENALLGTLVPRNRLAAILPIIAATIGLLAGMLAAFLLGSRILPAADTLTTGRLVVLLITWGVVGAAVGVAIHQLIQIPVQRARLRNSHQAKSTTQVLEEFGLGHRLNHRSSQLSGGERQRTAIARALANNPRILLADEPTGNLDAETGREILELLKKRHELGLTIVMVTHDPAVADYADRVVRLRDGQVVEDDSELDRDA